jgi:hypothetical protein
MSNGDDWYVAVANFVKMREHAIKMINKWTEQLREAENGLAQLQQVQATEQEQEPRHAI